MTDGWRRARELFPLPFVGVVVLLLILIFLTPNLLSGGAPAAGSLPTTAELIVDRSPSSNATHFYVKGLGTVRYASMRLSVGTNATWPSPSSWSKYDWRTAANGSDLLIVTAMSTANPVAVNVSATYVDTNGLVVEYAGLYEFNVSSGFLYTWSILPAASSVTATDLGALPLTLLLESVPPGSAP